MFAVMWAYVLSVIRVAFLYRTLKLFRTCLSDFQRCVVCQKSMTSITNSSNRALVFCVLH
jgi:hypothetical protein